MRDLRTVNCESGQCIESDKVIKRIGDITYRDLGVFSKIFFNSGTLLVSKGLDVTPVSGMTTKVSAGVGIQGTDTENFPFLMTEDVTLTLEAASGVARVDMIEMQVQSKKTKSDYSNVIISPETGTITPQLVNRDIQYFVALRTKTNSTTATPASAAKLTGTVQFLSSVDLSSKYIIAICDGEDGSFKEIDLRGSDPKATTSNEIVSKINSALGRNAAELINGYIILNGAGVGLTSYFAMRPPMSDSSRDALSVVFGLSNNGAYLYEYTGTNEWVKICEIDVGTNTTTLTAGMIRNLQNVGTWASGADKIRFNAEDSQIRLVSNVFTEILANQGSTIFIGGTNSIQNTPKGTSTTGFCYTAYWANLKIKTCRIVARELSSSLASWEIYCNAGTWGSWTQLTDANGNAINANSLDGVLASKYARTDVTPVFNSGAHDAEGGEINLAKPPVTTNLAGDMVVDVNTNAIRFWENGGNARGAYLDITQQGNGASSRIVTEAAGKAPSAKIADFLNGGASSINVADISARVNSGFWQCDTSSVTDKGWPTNPTGESNSGWWHLLSTTYSNTNSYYAMQLACQFRGSSLYFRATNNNGCTNWLKLVTSDMLGNLSQFSDAGYGILPNGLIMQWGKASIPSGQSVRVNLPIAFPTYAGYCNLCSPSYYGAAEANNAANFPNLYQLDIASGHHQTVVYRWVAIGY